MSEARVLRARPEPAVSSVLRFRLTLLIFVVVGPPVGGLVVIVSFVPATIVLAALVGTLVCWLLSRPFQPKAAA